MLLLHKDMGSPETCPLFDLMLMKLSRLLTGILQAWWHFRIASNGSGPLLFQEYEALSKVLHGAVKPTVFV
jgi:hypothetical protein